MVWSSKIPDLNFVKSVGNYMRSREAARLNESTKQLWDGPEWMDLLYCDELFSFGNVHVFYRGGGQVLAQFWL